MNTLNLKKLSTYLLTCSLLFSSAQSLANDKQPVAAPEVKIVQVSQSLIQMKLMKGITAEQAITTMVAKASTFNLELVGRQRISYALNRQGIKTPLLELLQFCNPVNAGSLVAKKIIYAAYIPCQISITANNEGEIWLLMKNMDMLNLAGEEVWNIPQ